MCAPADKSNQREGKKDGRKNDGKKFHGASKPKKS
jgi:hypothetical protein